MQKILSMGFVAIVLVCVTGEVAPAASANEHSSSGPIACRGNGAKCDLNGQCCSGYCQGGDGHTCIHK